MSVGRVFDATGVLVVVLAVWQAVFLYAGDAAISAPLDTAGYAFELLGRPRFWPHIEETMLAFAYALVISWIGGVGIGVWLGAHRLSGEVAEPMLVALYSLPKVTLYPLILLMFGLGTALSLAALGLMSRAALMRWRGNLMSAARGGKIVLGIGLALVGIGILTGAEKSIEAWLVDASPLWLTQLSTRL